MTLTIAWYYVLLPFAVGAVVGWVLCAILVSGIVLDTEDKIARLERKEDLKRYTPEKRVYDKAGSWHRDETA